MALCRWQVSSPSLVQGQERVERQCPRRLGREFQTHPHPNGSDNKRYLGALVILKVQIKASWFWDIFELSLYRTSAHFSFGSAFVSTSPSTIRKLNITCAGKQLQELHPCHTSLFSADYKAHRQPLSSL